MRANPSVLPVTAWKGLEEQVEDVIRQMVRNHRRTLLMPPGRLPGQTGKYSGFFNTAVMARTWRPTCRCIYLRKKYGKS